VAAIDAAPIQVGSTPNRSFADTTVVAGTTYVYYVQAIDGAMTSAPSAKDIATTIFFTDNLTPGTTAVKAVHLTELRAAVNAVLDAAGLPPGSFTDTATPGLVVKAYHVDQLRSALTTARNKWSLPPLPWTHNIGAGVTTIRAIDFEELRDGMR
jgi:hypothetical protein